MNLLESLSPLLSVLAWIATFTVIAARLLNMISYSSWGRPRGWLRYFNTERWILFRALIVASGFALGGYAFQTGALGHAWGNLVIAIVTLLPLDAATRQPLARFVAGYKKLLLHYAGAAIIFVLIPALLFVFELRAGSEMLDFGNAFQAAGGWILITGFTGMILGTWGKESAYSWSYIRLAVTWDLLLLIGAVLLQNPPLIALEVGALVIEGWNVSMKLKND